MPDETYIVVDLLTWKRYKQESLIQFVGRRSNSTQFLNWQTVFTPDFANPQNSYDPFDFTWDMDDKRTGHNSFFYKRGRNPKDEAYLFKSGNNAYELQAALYCFTSLANDEDLILAMSNPAHPANIRRPQAVLRIQSAAQFLSSLIVQIAKGGK